MATATTPMMRQYEALKQKYSDCILFFRLGDFYEMFGDDAREASGILQITLTARKDTPMCGVPYHAVENYLAKLTRAGKKVAICEQLSDPNLPGIVQRDVTRVVTPGTTWSDAVLDQKQHNFVSAIVERDQKYGLAWIDITTGQFFCAEFSKIHSVQYQLARIRPAECLIEKAASAGLRRALAQHDHMYLSETENFVNAEKVLNDHFGTRTLDGFGVQSMSAAVAAAGILFNYVRETQKTDCAHVQRLIPSSEADTMVLDPATIAHLELLENAQDGTRTHTLLSVLDKTVTAMGGRLLREYIVAPLQQKEKITARLDAVEELFLSPGVQPLLVERLRAVSDLERIIGKLSIGLGNARDLAAIRTTLHALPDLKNALAQMHQPLLQKITHAIDLLPELVDVLDRAIVDEPPLAVKEGGMIRAGFNAEIDELKNITQNGATALAQMQQRESTRTGISSLKVRFNKVFGYYIEISKSNLASVPPDYIRKQTLVNGERYITPELKEYEEKILGAEEKLVAREYHIFEEIRAQTLTYTAALQQTAKAIARLDVLLSFARVALESRYVKPKFTEENAMHIENGRHPVVEKVCAAGNFVSNNTVMTIDTYFHLITGPNMGGKSTYLRQVALIALIAHIGSFVPADKACMPLIDRIFTRIGASDNLVRGQSTFMVEMQETATILHNATNRSLIILDEIGRGTSTYDGVSLAWAIVEFLHDTLKAKAIFATHYHELIAVVEKCAHAKNLSVGVRENEREGVVFLYKLLEGGVDRSYGIEVAKLAGIPISVTQRAKHLLKDLEEGLGKEDLQPKAVHNPIPHPEHPVLAELKKLNVNAMTPMEALLALEKVKINLDKT